MLTILRFMLVKVSILNNVNVMVVTHCRVLILHTCNWWSTYS